MILVSAINGALEIAFDSLDFKLMKAEYLVALNRFKVYIIGNILWNSSKIFCDRAKTNCLTVIL